MTPMIAYNPKWLHPHEAVRLWNFWNRTGQRVRTTSADGGFEDCTAGAAYIDNAGQAVIKLSAHGLWLLQFVEVIRES